jgi:uncharacterized DUF497 family protein
VLIVRYASYRIYWSSRIAEMRLRHRKSLQPQHIPHAVKSGPFLGQPSRRAQRAAGESVDGFGFLTSPCYADSVIYEWHPGKARANLRKHSVSFEEAVTVFLDPLAITFPDPDHPGEEEREITIGLTTKHRAVFVLHCPRGDRTRIIGARKATRKERRQYEEGNYH